MGYSNYRDFAAALKRFCLKRLKSASWLILAVALLQCVISIPARASEPLSERALAQKLKLYSSISVLEVSFKQTKTLKDMGMQLKSEGHLSLHRPDQIRWEITQPSPLLISLDSKQIQIQTGKGADAPVQTLKVGGHSAEEPDLKGLAGLIAWLNLDSHSLVQQYEIVETANQSFRFVPKQKSNSPFDHLDMSLSKEGQLKRLTITEISGDTLEIEFGKPKLTYTSQ